MRHETPNESLLVYPAFSNKNLVAFTTTRNGGQSQSTAYSSFNMATHTGDHTQNVMKNREKLAALLAIKPHQLVFCNQTHSCNVTTVTQPPPMLNGSGWISEISDCDALITSVKGLCLVVLTADCVPLLLFDPVKKVIAAIHAGWKGTIGEIVPATVQQMQRDFGTNPADLIAQFGPSISQEIYETNPEVFEPFIDRFKPHAKDVVWVRNSKGFVNLALSNALLLTEQGVLPQNIRHNTYCTFKKPELFYSARYAGGNSGRIATGLILR